jgi:lysophospholipase L1-like esterase
MMSSSPDSDKAQSEVGIAGPQALLRALHGLFWREKWLFLTFLAALLLVEGVLRVFWPQLAGLIYAADMTGGHRIVLTEKSFRIPSGQEPPESPEILAIGDSTTFGTGVGAAQTWPLRLSYHLSAPVPVSNAGIEGSEPRQQVLGMRNLWSAPTPPRIVVLLVTGNMVSFTEFRKDAPAVGPQARAKSLRMQGQNVERGLKRRMIETVQASALWKALSLNINFGRYALGLKDHRVNVSAPLSPLLAYGWRQPDLPAEYIPKMWAEFETALTELEAETRALGSCLVLGFLPPRFMLGDARLDNLKFVPKTRLTLDAEAEVARLAADLDLPFVGITRVLQESRKAHSPMAKPYYIPGDYTHLNTDGHDLVASSMAVTLEPILAGEALCRNAR